MSTETTTETEINGRGLPGFGKELVLDLGGCDLEILENRAELTDYIGLLIDTIGMTAHGDPHVEEFGDGDLFGLTVFQFITTSNIDVTTEIGRPRIVNKVGMHAEPPARAAHINIFSCKDFDTAAATTLTVTFFNARSCKARTLDRSAPPVED